MAEMGSEYKGFMAIPDIGRWFKQDLTFGTSNVSHDIGTNGPRILPVVPEPDGFHDQLSVQLGHLRLSVRATPVDLIKKFTVLREAEEVFRLFCGMVEDCLPAKEEEKRAREAAGARDFDD